MTDMVSKRTAPTIARSDEPDTPEPRYHRRRSIIREFSLNTSSHGIPGIARSQSLPNRLYWTFALLIFTIIMGFFIAKTIMEYLSYSTQTSVSMEAERLQPFPAVSICNFSPMRFDAFIVPFLAYLRSRNLTTSNDTTTITANQSNHVYDFVQYIFNEKKPSAEYFFSLESMLQDCFFNDLPCNASDFVPFLSPKYGQCFTFNAKIKSTDDRVRLTTQNGGSGHLDLKLYAHRHQYVPYVSKGKVHSSRNHRLEVLMLTFARRCIGWYGGDDSRQRGIADDRRRRHLSWIRSEAQIDVQEKSVPVTTSSVHPMHQ